jgi:hypothetical protein
MKALFVSLIIAVLVGFVIFRRPTFMEQLALELGCNDRKALARATADMQRQCWSYRNFGLVWRDGAGL